MDIGDPSNFKRVQTIFDSDLRKMKNMIYAFSFSDTQTKNAIKELIQRNFPVAMYGEKFKTIFNF